MLVPFYLYSVSYCVLPLTLTLVKPWKSQDARRFHFVFIEMFSSIDHPTVNSCALYNTNNSEDSKHRIMMMQVLRAPAIARYAVRNNSMRNFSTVQKLADSNAVEDFRNLNSKAVMYFTASWCGREYSTSKMKVAFSKSHLTL